MGEKVEARKASSTPVDGPCEARPGIEGVSPSQGLACNRWKSMVREGVSPDRLRAWLGTYFRDVVLAADVHVDIPYQNGDNYAVRVKLPKHTKIFFSDLKKLGELYFCDIVSLQAAGENILEIRLYATPRTLHRISREVHVGGGA